MYVLHTLTHTHTHTPMLHSNWWLSVAHQHLWVCYAGTFLFNQLSSCQIFFFNWGFIISFSYMFLRQPVVQMYRKIINCRDYRLYQTSRKRCKHAYLNGLDVNLSAFNPFFSTLFSFQSSDHEKLYESIIYFTVPRPKKGTLLLFISM